MDNKIRNFRDLEAWRVGHQMVLEIYKVTEVFPTKEQFGLISQIRRAAVSFTSNIAEGFSRFSYSDKARFYFMARGSLSEVQNQLLIGKDLAFMGQDAFQKVWDLTEHTSALINGLIKSTTQRSNS